MFKIIETYLKITKNSSDHFQQLVCALLLFFTQVILIVQVAT